VEPSEVFRSQETCKVAHPEVGSPGTQVTHESVVLASLQLYSGHNPNTMKIKHLQGRHNPAQGENPYQKVIKSLPLFRINTAYCSNNWEKLSVLSGISKW
jgi:hypothetical protein